MSGLEKQFQHYPSMFITVGPARRRVAITPHMSEITLISMCQAHMQAFQAIHLEFDDNMFVPLGSSEQIALAATMVIMYHEKYTDTPCFDDDGWIEEAVQMEEATKAHMLAPSSESEEDFAEDETQTVDLYN